MILTLGEHRIRPFHECFTIEYMQHDKTGAPTGRWRHTESYPTVLEHALQRLGELELKRRGKGCTEFTQLLKEVRAMRDEIVALGSV